MTLIRIYRSKQNPIRLWLTVGLMVGLLIAIPFDPAYANGGTTILVEPVGPYSLTVTASPYPLQVGVTNDISALVGRQADQQLVLDAEVVIMVTPIDQAGKTQTLAASHDNATNKLYYATNVIFPTTGRWRITVQINGPDGSGETSFEEQVEAPSNRGALLWSIVGITAGVVAFVLALFVGRRSRDV
jgi:hypothetical protein